MNERITLGRREFLPLGVSTMEHDLYFMGLIKRAHLDEVAMAKGEAAEDFARRLLDAVIASGDALILLGCLIIPAEPPPLPGLHPSDRWTPELAEFTARFLGGLCEEEDKAAVRGLILSLLANFFEKGIVSLKTSATSSPATAESAKAEEPIPSEEPPAASAAGPNS